MTYAEYKEKRFDLEAEKNKINGQLSALDIAYLKTSPFQLGDKVRVKVNSRQTVDCFIDVVKTPYGFRSGEGEFRYDFAKMKKDGTMAQVSAGIYGYESIELLEKAEILQPLEN